MAGQEPQSASTTTTTSTNASTWKLPDGIEDHLANGVVKLAVGMTVGGLFGLVAFRTGGMRAASVATGAGVALGSTYERIRAGSK